MAGGATAPATSSSEAAAAAGDHLDPFRASKASRDEQTRRTQRLLTAATTQLPPSLPPRHSPTHHAVAVEGFLIRSLSKSEIVTLENDCRCRCDDWSRVGLMVQKRSGSCDNSNNSSGNIGIPTDLTAELRDQVRDTTFAGWILLGVDTSTIDKKSATANKPTGIRRNDLISNCILEPGCTVVGNVTMDRTHVCTGGSVINCGSITISNDGGEEFADEMTVTLGAESGGGIDVKVHVESTMIDTCHKVGMGSDLVSSSEFHYDNYPKTKLTMNVVCGGARVHHTPMVSTVYVASDAAIVNATSVTNAILLPQSEITNSCTASNVYLQWKAAITTNSSVSSTILMECSEIGPNCFVQSSVLGPDSHLSSGECHNSLIGPNTNSHHQSLLISVLWPLGRGNVGYGSNVGSNHTGRIPDQEVACGEGTFWGLGCVIKMPVNLCEAPYSIVAAGVQLPPQRIQMPFSLVLSGEGGNNQILPGWVLQSSPYTIARSEVKFAKRRKAKRHGFYTGWGIVRPRTIDMCWRARDALIKARTRAATSSAGQTSGESSQIFMSDNSIPGLGQNYLTESGRVKGIKAYTNIIHLYALRGLLYKVEVALKFCHKSFGDPVAPIEFERRLSGIIALDRRENDLPTASNNGRSVAWPHLPWDNISNDLPKQPKHDIWNHQRRCLKMEIPNILEGSSFGSNPSSEMDLILELLDRLIQLEEDYAMRIFKSKKRDDVRGDATIPGYTESHVSAEDDAVVKAANAECQRIKRSVDDVRCALGNHSSRL